MRHERILISGVICVWVWLLMDPSLAFGEDLIEFLSGAKSRGSVVQIKKDEREVVFESRLGDRRFRRVYTYDKIHAVTYKDKRYVLNKMPTPGTDKTKSVRRSKREVLELIDSVGRTPPDWYASTPLEYPETLDLSWPQKPAGSWNNKKNIGQYVWDIINPNTSKWRSGVRFVHHLMEYHKDDKEKRQRSMRTLGGMYFRLFQDYPRAAFWWHQSGVSGHDREALAECYWRLGNKRMALDTLDPQRVRHETIKLLGDMGETRRALQLAELYVKSVKEPQWGLLAAGDACRLDEKYTQAISYYERVLDGSSMNNESYDGRARHRARQSIDAIRQFELLDISEVDDGTYVGENMGYEGPLEVTVTVRSGRIETVKVTKHKEKQFYSALRDIPQQIISNQNLKNVDATSRATITAEAIISAAAKALTGDDGGETKKKFR